MKIRPTRGQYDNRSGARVRGAVHDRYDDFRVDRYQFDIDGKLVLHDHDGEGGTRDSDLGEREAAR